MFELPDLEKITLDLVAQIPKGKVSTFQAIAIALGDPIAARFVGSILAQHEQDSPWYRVVNYDGSITEEQAHFLHTEGVPVRDGRVVSVAKCLFRGFQSERPLQRLQAIQNEIRGKMHLIPNRTAYHTVGGVDLSYAGIHGIGAYVCLELPNLRVVAIHTLIREVRFPYIPSYLAFRELPVMLALLQKLKRDNALADITLVDGTGTLHHRQAGIASQLGVMLDIPTIGITKSLLHGEPEKSLKHLVPGAICYIRIEGQRSGVAIQPQTSAEPFFVSPGHGVDLETAIKLTRACLLASERLPEPIQQAHNASRRAAQELRQTAATPRNSQEEAHPEPAQLGLFDKLMQKP